MMKRCAPNRSELAIGLPNRTLLKIFKDMKTIDSATLQDRLSNNESQIIIDVLPDDSFDKCHLPGAQNACVYEIEFLEKAESIAPDKSAEIIVYGEDDRFEASSLAFEKLKGAGWENVSVLSEGLNRWIEQGLETHGKGDSSSALTGRFKVDPQRSTVRWIGRNLLNQHDGTVALQEAAIELDQGKLVGGNAILDMNRIICEDISDSAVNKMLIGHLRTDDFFLIDQFPTAQFELNYTATIPDARPGSPNYNIAGAFTLRGSTEPIAFDATLGTNDTDIALQAHFDIDRVLWGSKYGSGKIYEALGKHVVNDRISISFQLIAPIA